MRKLNEYNFSIALSKVKNGKRIRRQGWPVWLILSQGNKLYLMDTENGTSALWTPTQNDILATDWVVEGE